MNRFVIPPSSFQQEEKYNTIQIPISHESLVRSLLSLSSLQAIPLLRMADGMEKGNDIK